MTEARLSGPFKPSHSLRFFISCFLFFVVLVFKTGFLFSSDPDGLGESETLQCSGAPSFLTVPI